MKTLKIIFTVMCLCAPFYAQAPGQSTAIRPVTILPAHCNANRGETVFLIGDGLYSCNATDTWTKIGAGAGTISDTVTNLNTLLTTAGQVGQATDGTRGPYWKSGGFVHPISTEINVQDFGARGDGGTYSQVACTNTSGTITNVGLIAGRLPKVGDNILVSGCGSAGADLSGVVSGGTATTGTLFGTVTLSGGVKASATLANRGATWGGSLDDTTAFSNAISYCQNTVNTGGCTIRIPSGVFFISNITLPVQGTPALHNGQVRIVGAGRSSTWIIGTGADQSAIFTTPASSVSTDIQNIAFTSYDYNNKSQWAVQWKGGTEHTFQNNYVTQTYGMVSAANTWYNLIFNNRCYGAYGDCIEFGGAAGTGPVNNTNVISNVLSEAHGWHIHSHTNNGSWGNTYIGNDQEQSIPFVGLIMIGESNTNFQGGYLETTNQGASGGFDVVINGNGNFSWATWPCTQINGVAGVAIYGTASSTNTCAATPNFVNTVAGVVFYGPTIASINAPTTATTYGGLNARIYGTFAFRNSTESPYKTTTMEWTSATGSGATLAQSMASAFAANPTTPNTTSGATFGSGILSSVVWNNKINAYNSDPNTNSVLGWACVAGSPFQCVSTGGGAYSSGVWAELGIARLKRVREGTAAPVSNAWTVGDFVQNINPASNGIFGWICTAAGTPGTWQAIYAIDVTAPPALGATTPNTVKATTVNATTAIQVNGTPIVQSCGTTTTCSNTAVPLGRLVTGVVTLGTGTATVTSLSPAFTSTTSFVCTCTDQNTTPAACSVQNTSTTSITVKGTGTDVINYMCVGN